jgi:hypothetical protein
MTTQTTQMIASSPAEPPVIRPGFNSAQGYALLDRMATIFSASHLVPTLYRASKANCIIACHMASRINVDPLTVMQNLYLVNGKPSWSSQFLIALWNGCGQFTPIRYEWSEDRKSCRAVSTELRNGDKIIGTTITMAMAKAEGWIDKPGSKWRTMPEQMMMYRAAAFLVRAFAADLALGLGTKEESEDVSGVRAEEYPALPPVEMPTAESLAGGASVSAAAGGTITGNPTGGVTVQVVEVVSVSTASPSSAEKVSQVQQAQHQQVQATDTEQDVAPSASLSADAPVSQETISYLGELIKELNPPMDLWKKTLHAKYGVESAKLLTEAQALKVVKWAKEKVEAKRLTEWSTGAAQKKEGAVSVTAPFSS